MSLTKVMKEKGVNAKRLAWVLDVHQVSINNWMSNRVKMSKATVLGLSQVLGVSPEEISDDYDFTKTIK